MNRIIYQSAVIWYWFCECLKRLEITWIWNNKHERLHQNWGFNNLSVLFDFKFYSLHLTLCTFAMRTVHINGKLGNRSNDNVLFSIMFWRMPKQETTAWTISPRAASRDFPATSEEINSEITWYEQSVLNYHNYHTPQQYYIQKHAKINTTILMPNPSNHKHRTHLRL
jgi:hypothetical protein